MIDLNQIRIGNWIHHNESWSYRNEESKAHDFEWNDSDWYQLAECCLDEKDLSFIPLTEEWLNKLGVKQIAMNKFKHISSGLDLECSYELKYVHQLQNLYFALTGKELQLKQLT